MNNKQVNDLLKTISFKTLKKALKDADFRIEGKTPTIPQLKALAREMVLQLVIDHMQNPYVIATTQYGLEAAYDTQGRLTLTLALK